MSYGRNKFGSAEDSIRDKLNDELKRLSKDNNRLRDQRNQYKHENSVLKKDNKELSNDKFELKLNIQDLETKNKNLDKELLEIRTKSAENIRKFNDFALKVEIYKERKNNEINKLNTDFDNELNLRKTIENKNRVVIKERDEAIDKLSDQKKKNRESLHCKSMVNDLNKTVESLTKDNKDLENRLILEIKKKRESVESQQMIEDLKQTVNDLNNRLKNQIEFNNSQSIQYESEVLKLKTSFNSQITALKKQRSYFQKCNETNKRKQLATQYLFVGHENMFSKNASKIHESIQKNTNEHIEDLKEEIIELLENKSKRLKSANLNGIADVIRSNVSIGQQIHEKANKILGKPDDGSVACPECELKFNGITEAKKHLELKHFKNWESVFGPSSDANQTQKKIIDCIDLLED